jgi:transposase
MTRLQVQAKCRLQATLQRYHILPPKEGKLFAEYHKDWWRSLSLSPLEKVRIESDLATFSFAQEQIHAFEKRMAEWASHEENVTRLMQITGIAFITAVILLSAIGDVHRFPSPDQLVGYSGLGARVHDSGLSSRTGGITKAGRKDIRTAMVESAQSAVLHDPFWKAEYKRLEPRLGHPKTIVAIARKMLVVAWYLLTKKVLFHKLDADRMARKFMEFAYSMDTAQRGKSAKVFIRERLDLLDIGKEIEFIHQGKRHIPLPKNVLTLK